MRSGDETLVEKISWPHASRRVEGSLIDVVRTPIQAKRPDYQGLVAELECSMARTMVQMALPRVSRTLILHRYERLETAESVEDFKIIFTDVVRGAYCLSMCPWLCANRHSSSSLGLGHVVNPAPGYQHEQHHVVPRRRQSHWRLV